MDYGISILPLIPGRANPSDKAEMVTQILFGECYQILNTEKKWVLIRNEPDGYECWIDRKQVRHIGEGEVEKMSADGRKRCGDALGFLTSASKMRFGIPCSSILPDYSEGFASIDGQLLEFDGRIARTDPESAVRHAKRLLNAPYLWGGKTLLGIDCSGLLQVSYACAGVQLPRDAYQQAEFGEAVDFIDLAEAGDLAFFDNEDGRITHVGMITEKNKIIHASGHVRIDRIDHHGIYQEEQKGYSHKLRAIKRLKLLSE